VNNFIVFIFSLRSVVAFRAEVINRIGINPNFGQQFRWIGGMWQKPFPSARDRVLPSQYYTADSRRRSSGTGVGRQRRLSLPARVSRDAEEGLTERQRGIMLRTAVRPATTRHRVTAAGQSRHEI